MNQKDKNIRPGVYNYSDELKKHLNGDFKKIFDGKLTFPRQIELHLPADHKKSCNFDCYYCQGKILDKSLGEFEIEALELLNKLKGKIPYIIYGGAYSEPMLNPYLMSFLATTKKYNSCFGIHTNGSMLKILEETQGWITELCRLANDQKDYLSISLDAGTAESHKKIKNLDKNYFDDIIEGIRTTIKIRGDRKYPTIRVCYLMNPLNSSEKEIKGIIKIMREIGVDSLRFSMPYDIYGKDFKEVKKYRDNVEVKQWKEKEKMLKPLMSSGKPFIFYIPPSCQDIEKMKFKQCIYNYFQITLGADGYVYKCSSMATPSFKGVRLGKITSDLKEFEKMIMKNSNPDFDPQICFKQGGRCNRMAVEINNEWENEN